MSIMASNRGVSRRPRSGPKPYRLQARWLAALAAATVLGACSDAFSPGLAPSPGSAALSARTAGSVFIPNAVRYSDRGGRPVTGRAGNAAASVFAVMDATGRTHVRIAAQNAIGGGGAPTLSQVQVKAYGADGKLHFTRNYRPTAGQAEASYQVGGLGRGDRVQVQATVRTGGAARTGVVTVNAPVLMGPNLRVESLAAPARVAARTLNSLSALIRETNGDIGAQAQCALFVGGQEVDRAWGIWVDAGGAVSCVFAHMFQATGTVPVEVRLLNVMPADLDASDNSASAVVEVIDVPSDFEFDARFEDRTFDSYSRYSSSFRTGEGWGSESDSEYESSGRTQEGHLWAWMFQKTTFPLTELFVRQYTRDETAHGALFTDLDADWGYDMGFEARWCASRYFDQLNGRAWLEVCAISLGGGAVEVTTLSYSRHAGDVAYRSRGHSRWWNRDLGIDDVYSWNDDGQDTFGRFVSYGRQYAFLARIEDANGVRSMNPFVWLEPFTEAYESPLFCGEWADEYGESRWCNESRHTASGVRGWVFGLPTN